MNQKEAIKLAVMDNQMKNIETKLDEHIANGKKDSEDNKKQQKEILTQLGVFHDLLAIKADRTEVENIKNKIAYWAGGLVVIVFLITLIISNFDKIFGGSL